MQCRECSAYSFNGPRRLESEILEPREGSLLNNLFCNAEDTYFYFFLFLQPVSEMHTHLSDCPGAMRKTLQKRFQRK